MYAPSSHREVRRLASELYAERRDYLLAIARRNAINAGDAEEALQEAIVSFIRHFDPDRGAPPLAWLTLTLKRQCWRQHREAHLDRYIGQEAERGGEELGSFLEAIPARSSGPEELLLKREATRTRLGRLKPDECSALLLQAAGYSYREIGERCGWTHTKIR